MPTRGEAMAARPVRLVEPDVDPIEGGGAKLKVRVRPTRAARFFRMPEGATKTFELDDIGLNVWNLIDGKTSVKQIIHKLAAQYKLNLREAEVSTLAFLQTLMRKGLIGVPVKKSN